MARPSLREEVSSDFAMDELARNYDREAVLRNALAATEVLAKHIPEAERKTFYALQNAIVTTIKSDLARNEILRSGSASQFRLRVVAGITGITIGQKVALGMKREPIERARAKARVHSRTYEGRVSEIIATSVGLKNDAYIRGRYILENGTDEVREMFLAGRISVNQAYCQTRALRAANPVEISTGTA